MKATTYLVDQSALTDECWWVQIKGFPACHGCEFLGTKECGGKDVRRRMYKGEFPVRGIGKEVEKNVN